jgi:hypothetical protein
LTTRDVGDDDPAMVFDYASDIEWVAVVVAAVAGFAVGSVWFAPPVFGNYWAGHVSRYTQRRSPRPR